MSEKYINAGTVLINLEKIRKDRKYYDLINITKKKFLKNNDQTSINYVLYPKIGRMPDKYIFFNFHDRLDIELYLKSLRQKIDLDKFEEFYSDPTIIHYVLCAPKIWFTKTKYIKKVTKCEERKNCSCMRDHNLWLAFAKKTYFYEEIYKYYRRRNK